MKQRKWFKSGIVLVSTLMLGVGFSEVVSHAAITDATYTASTNIDKSNSNDRETPHMKLSEAIASDVHEAILTDIDVPEIANKLNEIAAHSRTTRSAKKKGHWKYMYTAEPYAFYRNTKTKQWKMVQVTSTTQHVVNTMVGGYAGAPSYGGVHY